MVALVLLYIFLRIVRSVRTGEIKIFYLAILGYGNDSFFFGP